MININDEYEVTIYDTDYQGQGIARVNNFVVFVPKALTGEKVLIKIISKEKKYATSQIIKIITPSSNRIEPRCPKYNECGGCNFAHTTYKIENEIKEDYIRNLFPNEKINQIIFDQEYYNRNKVVLHVQNKKIGLYRERSNTIIPIESCFLLNEHINNIIKVINNLNLSKVKEIIIRYSNYNEQIMIIFKGDINNYEVLKEQEQIKSIYINDKLVYGNKYIEEKIGKYIYQISATSFFQTNLAITNKLYNYINNHIDCGDKLLDLYCGTGTIGIYVSNHFNKVTGIEINQEAIQDANHNKKINFINNINFKCQDSSNIINEYYDTIIVDPPRSGLNKKVIQQIIKINPKKIIYVSCNPITLKRDLEQLNIYQIKEITPLNMFPRSKHVECVCILNHH